MMSTARGTDPRSDALADLLTLLGNPAAVKAQAQVLQDKLDALHQEEAAWVSAKQAHDSAAQSAQDAISALKDKEAELASREAAVTKREADANTKHQTLDAKLTALKSLLA